MVNGSVLIPIALDHLHYSSELRFGSNLSYTVHLMSSIEVFEPPSEGESDLASAIAEATPEDHIDATSDQMHRIKVARAQRVAYLKEVEQEVLRLNGVLVGLDEDDKVSQNKVKFRINQQLNLRQEHLDEIDDLNKRIDAYQDRLHSLTDIHEAGDKIDPAQLDL